MENRRLLGNGLILAVLLMALMALLLPVLAETVPPAGMTDDEYNATLPKVTIALTDKGIMVTPMPLTVGDHFVTVRNDTDSQRGIELTGVDIGDNPLVRYSPVLQPKKTDSFRWYFSANRSNFLRDMTSWKPCGVMACTVTFGEMRKFFHVGGVNPRDAEGYPESPAVKKEMQ